MVSNNTFTFSNLADAFIRLTKRLTIGEYMKRFILKRQNKYKLAREGINKEKLFFGGFFWGGGGGFMMKSGSVERDEFSVVD